MSRHIIGYYALGSGSLDGEALENALKTDAHLPIESVDYAASGGGIYTTGARGVMLGGELQAIIDQDAGGNYEAAVGLGYGLVNLGYSFKFGPLRVYPLFGVGGGGIGLDLEPIAQRAMPDLHSIHLNRTNFLVHIGLGGEFQIGRRLGMVIGGRVGYIFAPFSNRQGIRGPYFRLFFGGQARL